MPGFIDRFLSQAFTTDSNFRQAWPRDLAARIARVLALAFRPLQSEGAGNAGRPMRPQAACAEVVGGEHTRWSGHTGNRPAFPAQWFYGLCRTLPGDRAFLSPSPLRSLLLTSLTPASRRQDHTILPSARQAPSSLAPLASTASCPASVTISSRPSVGQDGRVIKVIWVFGKSEYFSKRGWTGFC
jgi:hypothetical protein